MVQLGEAADFTTTLLETGSKKRIHRRSSLSTPHLISDTTKVNAIRIAHVTR